MPQIILETPIAAPIEVCYDLALSVDLHQLSTAQTHEHIVAGVKQGIMQLGDTVTWRARHFGIWLQLTSKITVAHRPTYFVDQMQKGPFSALRHEHYFTETQQGVLMKDVFMFRSPFGILGKIVDSLILENYLKRFLAERNGYIKEIAESGRWKEILSHTQD